MPTSCASTTPSEYNVESVDEQKDQYLLSLKAKTGDVAYDRLKMWVDKQHLLPVTIECYAASGLLIKTLHFKDIKDFGGGIKRPATLETDSPLYKGYKSVMLWSGLKKASYPGRDLHAQLPAAGRRAAQMNPLPRAWRCWPLVLLALAAGARADEYSFDASQFEKKPFEINGYVRVQGRGFLAQSRRGVLQAGLLTASRSARTSGAPARRWI